MGQISYVKMQTIIFFVVINCECNFSVNFSMDYRILIEMVGNTKIGKRKGAEQEAHAALRTNTAKEGTR